MYALIIVLPFLSSISCGLFGRKIGVKGAHLVSCFCISLCTVISLVLFVEVCLNNILVNITLFTWIDSETLNIFWSFTYDSLTVSMLMPVLVISSLVHIYSIGYMNMDPHNQRFFCYLSLFTWFMIILVTSNSYLLMFVGWEGVGVCSYLLVNFWYTRIAANQSSVSAFFTNRVGDCILTIGIFAIIFSFGNADYSVVYSLSAYVSNNIINLIGICLLIGAMAKSSQLGLHIWLPLAMEGPTPVSALIHAATMVTAGVYLLIRSSPLIEYSSLVLLFCLLIGAITTLFSSLIGFFQQDIKKVIAYSTMSQLGMMVISIGLSSYNTALYHLINHAFYKGLLFLGAGAVIHSLYDNQDFRKYGSAKLFLPLSYSIMLIGSLSLIALPFMSGFYSKDLILESCYAQFSLYSTFVYYISVTGAIFTTLYSAKILYITFISIPNGSRNDYSNVHESDVYISIPLIILSLFSILFGYLGKDLFVGLGSTVFSDNAVFVHNIHDVLISSEFGISTLIKLTPFILTIVFFMLYLIIYELLKTTASKYVFYRISYYIFGILNQRFYIEYLYNKYITNKILNAGGYTTKFIDKGSIELVGPYGLENLLINLSNKINNFNTAFIPEYGLYIFIGLITFILTPLDSMHSILVIITLATLNDIMYNKKNTQL